MLQHLWIPGRFPNLNDLVEAGAGLGRAVGHSGRRYNGYRALKREWEARVVLLARAHLKPPGPAYYTYVLHEPDRRRDPSNILGAVIKIVEDGLRHADVIPNDGWADVLGIATYWLVDKRAPGATLFLSQEDVLGRDDALTRAMEIEHDGKTRR